MAEPSLRRVEAVFDQALDLDPARLAAFLDEQCAGDADLRAAVEELLQLDRRAQAGEALLHSPLVRDLKPPSTFPAPPAGPPVPPRIGRYRVVRLLGEGGMGVVYEAEQDSPRRPVALKVIRPGLVSPALRQRFAQEAQILGRLRHPGVAQIYEAGVAEDGQPFFALEFIRGLPLDDYARLRGLTAPARLELLARVCDAVQHAHDQGVIHRDLKPSNLLVDESGQPKVLDFGVARATDAELRAGRDLTTTGQLVGTVSYMSPEQLAAGSALDARSDVYTLGVILFELLAGRLPYPVEQLPLPTAAWMIREEDPVRLGLLDGQLRGDVETIVAKALAKEPARRYPSAAELAEDIRRHLAHEPIRARPPSALYQLGKFVRRHKALVSTTAVFLTVLLVGGAVTAWQAVQLAQAERDQVVQQTERSRKVRAALDRAVGLRDRAREANDPGKWAEAREEVRGAKALTDDGAVEPGLAERVKVLRHELDEEQAVHQLIDRLEQIRLLQAEVNVTKNLFAMERSLPEYRKAFADYGLRPASTTPAEAAALLRRRRAVRDAVVAGLDDWLALARLEKAAEVRWLERVLAAADPDPLRKRLRAAVVRWDTKAFLDLAREVNVATQTPQALFLLEHALRVSGSPEVGVELLRRAQAAHSGDFWINENLGMALYRSSNLDEAIRFMTAAVALRPKSPVARSNLGAALWKKGRLEEAGDALRKAIELNSEYAQAHYNLGIVLRDQKDLPGAEKCFRRATELAPKDLQAHLELGNVLYRRGDLPGAERSQRRATELAPKDTKGHCNLGMVLTVKGDLPGAEASYRRALALDPKHALARCELGHALLLQGEFRAALAEARTGHDLGSRRKDWVYPSAFAIRTCEHLIKLDDRLPAILQGADQPQNISECLDLAELCRYKRLYATSVRFFAEAFAAGAKLGEDLLTRCRYHAACSAAQAGCGQGAEAARPDESERARLRRQALEWLRAELASRPRLGVGGKPQDRAGVWARLSVWQTDPALAGVRDADRLAALPAAERAGWEKLWADVDATVAKAREPK
jgi:Flp pilus assembly protein TadD/tRNA A-37 threonylcarbamoyl transferase component Bud32